MTQNPAVIAHLVIEDVIRDGLQKHEPEGWRNETASFHLHKAARHALTAVMIEQGDIPCDGEDHVALALTRMAMAKVVQVSE